MRILGLVAAASTLVAGCGSGGSGPSAEPSNGTQSAEPAATAGEPAGRASASGWDLKAGADGLALALAAPDGPALRLACAPGGKGLAVNVPGFRPVGSEERLSFGSGGSVSALVADSRGDKRLGGVSATGPVPADLAALIGGPVSASYGAQRSGPHPAPPSALASAFVAACRPEAAAPPEPGPAASTSPCLSQDGKPVRPVALRAVGTEPFWNAQVEGRCVTYSNPEDQKGTRVWTRFVDAPDGGEWTGRLGGSAFVLRIRPKPGCSDGMSDKRYPLAAELTVGGETRRGCAVALVLSAVRASRR